MVPIMLLVEIALVVVKIANPQVREGKKSSRRDDNKTGRSRYDAFSKKSGKGKSSRKKSNKATKRSQSKKSKSKRKR